ncbi:hypothetical protein, partial [Pseudomonas sp. FW305-BF6]
SKDNSSTEDTTDIVIPDSKTTGIDKNVYEITNYVNDVNRMYTQQLMTYDGEGNIKNAFVYGNNDERLTREKVQNDSET